jgi:hypothetical protein
MDFVLFCVYLCFHYDMMSFMSFHRIWMAYCPLAPVLMRHIR